MKQLFASYIAALGLVAAQPATAHEPPRLPQESADHNADHVMAEIENLADRAAKAGLHTRYLSQTLPSGATTGHEGANYDVAQFESIVEYALSTTIGPKSGKSDNCVKDTVIRNILRVTGDTMSGRDTRNEAPLFHNTWYNVAFSCSGKPMGKQQEVQQDWDKAAVALRQIKFDMQ